ERIDACDDERFQIRALESTFLELLHRVVHALVELQELVGTLAARRERVGQLAAEEFVAALEDGVVDAAGESAVLLVAETEREERRFLEFDGELALRTVIESREGFGESCHLERALTKVVRLLGVQEENAMRDLRLRHDECDDRLRAELPHCADAV